MGTKFLVRITTKGKDTTRVEKQKDQTPIPGTPSIEDMHWEDKFP